MLIGKQCHGPPGIEISNLEKWSRLDALGQAVLVYEMGGVPSVTGKRTRRTAPAFWLMHQHECPVILLVCIRIGIS